jgi:hypothetical protein
MKLSRWIGVESYNLILISPREVFSEIIVLLLPPGELQESMQKRLNKMNNLIDMCFMKFRF